MTEAEAIAELARMVAGMAHRCWENLGTDYAGSIIERCGQIAEALHIDGGSGEG